MIDDENDQDEIANPGDDVLEDFDNPWDFSNLPPEEQAAAEAEQTAEDIYEEVAEEREEGWEGSAAEVVEGGEAESEPVMHSGGRRSPFKNTFWRK